MENIDLSTLWASSPYDGLMIDEAMAKLVNSSFGAAAADGSPIILDPPQNWNKWECRSGLQKNIRRGREAQAMACALRLAAIDARYCWYSLHIIAMEDVGPGDPWTVLWTRQILSGIQPALRKVDGVEAMLALVARMCRAPKSRAFCEISAAMEASDQGKALLREAVAWSAEKLVDAAVSYDKWLECHAALAHITNRVPKGFPRNPEWVVARDVVIAGIMHQEDVPIVVRRAARAVILGPTDSMCLGVWAVGRTIWRQRDCWMSVEHDDMPVEDVVNGLPAATFDMHTRGGKLALEAFYTSLCKVYPEIKEISELRAVSAQGYVVFFDEGAKVDRRIRSDWLNALMNWQEASCCEAYGVPKHVYTSVREIVRSEFPRLHKKRHWAVKMFAE